RRLMRDPPPRPAHAYRSLSHVPYLTGRCLMRHPRLSRRLPPSPPEKSLSAYRLQHAVSCALSHGPLSHETPPRVAAFTAKPGGESPISRALHALSRHLSHGITRCLTCSGPRPPVSSDTPARPGVDRRARPSKPPFTGT